MSTARQRLADLRLAAGVLLPDRVEVAEALLSGVVVPARRLDPRWAEALSLDGDVVLDEGLAFRVAGHGPLPETTKPRQGRAA